MTKRKYGLPFHGCISTVDRHEVPINCIGPDSREMLVEPGRIPELVKIKRRNGTEGFGSATGILEMAIAQATMRGVQLYEMPTTISQDGYPVPTVLFTDESKKYGQIYHRDSIDYVEGEEFGNFHYSTSASTANNIKVPPIPYNGNGATGYNRLAFEENRRRTVAGTRRRAGVKDWEYDPGFWSAPTRSYRKWNISSGSGSNNLTRYPIGLITPGFPPTIKSSSMPTKHAAAGPWREGDTYFLITAFEDEHGHVSMPCIPRDKNSILTGGYGLIVVPDDGAGADEYYDYVAYQHIAIGPPGTKKRRLYRTLKKTKTQIANGEWPDLGTLRLCAIIENNTVTEYNDPRGVDGSLVNDINLRLDQVWPDRSRYAIPFGQRLMLGYLSANPYAICLFPTGLTNSRDINDSFDATPGSTLFMYQIRQDTAGAMVLYIRKSAFGAAIPTEVTISLSSTTTLQQVVDTICATTTASASGEWAAQMIPGADSNATATRLAPTHIDVATCTFSNGSPNVSTAAASDFTNVAEGMKVNHASYPAGTYVKTKTDNQNIILSANSTAPGAAVTIEFYADTGDDACFTDATAHSQYGNIRAWGNSYPGFLAFKQSYLDELGTNKGDFIVTSAGPNGRPNAANLFHTSPGGRYTAESAAGIFQGAAPLDRGCIVFYSNRIGYWSNEKSGDTGEDADYRMKWIDMTHGCKSPYSIASGNNWAGCWREDGFFITDGQKSAIISLAHFDMENSLGELSYEAGLCQKAAAADTNDYYMFADFCNGTLRLGYRYDATHGAVVAYDASQSIEASGIQQMLKPDGTPYGWSSRLDYSWRGTGSGGVLGALGHCVSSSGMLLLQCDDKNDKTNCGLLQRYQKPGLWSDGASPVDFLAYGTADMLGGRFKFSLKGTILILYKYVSSLNNTQALIFSTNQDRTSGASISLPKTSTDFVSRKVVPVPIKLASPLSLIEWTLNGVTGVGDEDFELTGIEIEPGLLTSLN